MKLKPILFSILILTALFVSAFGSLSTVPFSRAQLTATVPAIIDTIVPGTPVVVTATGVVVVPVTGGNGPNPVWTFSLFGLLAVLLIAFLLAIFIQRPRGPIDNGPPPPPEV